MGGIILFLRSVCPLKKKKEARKSALFDFYNLELATPPERSHNYACNIIMHNYITVVFLIQIKITMLL